MRTSHRQIRKRILDVKSKITDEEFFSSRAYNGYLTDLAEAATKRYKRPLRVQVVADHNDETVAFTDYSDFDTYDKNNRYRLMDMSARDCNRDGAALRFVAEKLSKQTSEVKILMIICDGQPNDDGYSGSAAEADLRGIKLEYARKGVKIYAAAIGEDRPRIERIYGDGYLDITNLQELPVMLTNLIVRSLPH